MRGIHRFGEYLLHNRSAILIHEGFPFTDKRGQRCGRKSFRPSVRDAHEHALAARCAVAVVASRLPFAEGADNDRCDVDGN